MSRAADILHQVDEIVPLAGVAIAAGAAGTAANIIAQRRQQKKAADYKARMGGAGQRMDKAKAQLKAAKKQKRFAVGQKRAAAKQQIGQAKAAHKTAMNKGLSRFATKLSKASGETGQQLRKKEVGN